MILTCERKADVCDLLVHYCIISPDGVSKVIGYYCKLPMLKLSDVQRVLIRLIFSKRSVTSNIESFNVCRFHKGHLEAHPAVCIPDLCQSSVFCVTVDISVFSHILLVGYSLYTYCHQMTIYTYMFSSSRPRIFLKEKQSSTNSCDT